MSELSVQISRFKVGEGVLDLNQILPTHKKKIESFLSNYFSKIETASTSDRTFQLSMEKSSEFESIKPIIRYYQNMGLLPRKAMSPAEVKLVKKTASVAVEAMRKASIPGTTSQILAGTRIADDSISVLRNILFAIPAIGADDPIVNHLGDYAGVFYAFLGLRELDGGWSDYKQALLIDDKEGNRRAKARIISGGVVTGGALTYVAGKICDTLHSPAAVGALGAANALFGVGSAISMGSSLWGWIRCHRFNNKLNEYLLNSNFSQLERLQGTLRFLKDTISITPEEIVKLSSDIEKSHPHLKGEEKQDLVNKKMNSLSELKVKYLKRRTSNKSLLLILNNVDTILAKLGSKDKRAEGIKDASLLLQKIQSENWTKMTMYILSFIAAAISLTAAIICSIVALVPLPFVLYGIAGAIHVSLSVYTTAGMLTKEGRKPGVLGDNIKKLSN